MKYLLVLLTLFLVGCANNYPTPTKTETIYLFPPDAYMTPCRRDIPLGSTLEEIIQHQDRTISLCDAKLSSQREWKENRNE